MQSKKKLQEVLTFKIYIQRVFFPKNSVKELSGFVQQLYYKNHYMWVYL